MRREPAARRLEPDAEALIVNRMAEPHRYAIAPIDRCYELVGLIKSRWEGISGGRAVESARRRASSPSSTPRRAVMTLEVERSRRRAPRPPPPRRRSPCSAWRRSPARGWRRRCASSCTSSEPSGRDDPRDRALGADHVEPARRAPRRRDPRAAGRPVRRARALGRDDAPASCGRRSTALVPTFTGAATFTLTLPCTYDLEVAASQATSTRCPTARCRSSFHFSGTILYAGEHDRAADRARCRGAASTRWRMPVGDLAAR